MCTFLDVNLYIIFLYRYKYFADFEQTYTAHVLVHNSIIEERYTVVTQGNVRFNISLTLFISFFFHFKVQCL